jgi:hypothetical protein
MGVAQDDQYHWAASQGVPATNPADGDPARGGSLLSALGLHLVEDGTTLEINPCRESAQEPAVLPGDGLQTIYTRKLTLPVVGFGLKCEGMTSLGGCYTADHPIQRMVMSRSSDEPWSQDCKRSRCFKVSGHPPKHFYTKSFTLN